MIDIGDLVTLKHDPGKLGLVVNKKLIRGAYAAPIDERARECFPERLTLLCYWTSGAAQWIAPDMLIIATEDP
jgi:hypothetical protein